MALGLTILSALLPRANLLIEYRVKRAGKGLEASGHAVGLLSHPVESRVSPRG